MIKTFTLLVTRSWSLALGHSLVTLSSKLGPTPCHALRLTFHTLAHSRALSPTLAHSRRLSPLSPTHQLTPTLTNSHQLSPFTSVMLINKADYLTTAQRAVWADELKSQGLRFGTSPSPLSPLFATPPLAPALAPRPSPSLVALALALPPPSSPPTRDYMMILHIMSSFHRTGLIT